MPVVSISRQFGAGGHTLAERVAKRLNYEYLDQELVLRLVKTANLPGQNLKTADLIQGLQYIGSRIHSGVIERLVMQSPPQTGEADLSVWLDRIVKDLAERGNVVFLGRGSQFILPSGPGTIKILLVAKKEDRERFLMVNYNLTADEAREAVRETDAEREGFLKRFTDKSPNSPDIYDLAINVSMISLQAAEALICNLVTRRNK